MAESVILNGGPAEIRISTFGSNVVRFISGGREVFFPRQNIREKERGGMHFCLPWFGSSPRGPRKHGFLRETRAIRSSIKSRELSMDFHLNSTEKYPWELNSSAVTKISESGIFESLLRIERPKDDKIEDPAPILPGFHPYFAGNAADARVMVGNEEYCGFSEKSNSVPFTGNPVMIFLPDRTIEIELGGAFMQYEPHLVLWSDSPKNYFCVEPILQPAPLFESDHGCYLDPGEDLEVSLSITVR